MCCHKEFNCKEYDKHFEEFEKTSTSNTISICKFCGKQMWEVDVPFHLRNKHPITCVNCNKSYPTMQLYNLKCEHKICRVCVYTRCSLINKDNSKVDFTLACPICLTVKELPSNSTNKDEESKEENKCEDLRESFQVTLKDSSEGGICKGCESPLKSLLLDIHNCNHTQVCLTCIKKTAVCIGQLYFYYVPSVCYDSKCKAKLSKNFLQAILQFCVVGREVAERYLEKHYP